MCYITQLTADFVVTQWWKEIKTNHRIIAFFILAVTWLNACDCIRMYCLIAQSLILQC